MNKVFGVLIVLTLSLFVMAQNAVPPPPTTAQQPATTPPQQNAQLQPGSLIYAELSKSIDAKKAKVGDPVQGKITQAVLSHGKVVIPKNAKLVGHLTDVKASSKDQPQSELGIVFDRAELKDGTQIPLTSATIQAMGVPSGLDQSPSNIAGGGGPEPSGMPGSRTGGGNMGGMSSPMGGNPYPSNPGAAGTDETPAPSTTQPQNSGKLNAGSRGVFGMSGVRLEPQAQGGKVAREGKNIKLDGGMQLVLRTQ